MTWHSSQIEKNKISFKRFLNSWLYDCRYKLLQGWPQCYELLLLAALFLFPQTQKFFQEYLEERGETVEAGPY